MELDNYQLTTILEDEANKAAKTMTEYFAKLKEIKSKRRLIDSNRTIDFKQIQMKLSKYEKQIQLLQENLSQVYKENRRLLEEIQRLQNKEKQNKELLH